MARIRSIKPEFWSDEELAEIPRDARLLYIGLWNLADEHGRLRGAPRYVKGQIFPYDDDLSAADVDDLLDALAGIGKVRRYRVAGSEYLWLPNLDRHQRLESAKVASKLPDPEAVDALAQIRADKSARRTDKSAPGADESEPIPDESISNESNATEQAKQSAQIGADKSARGADKSSLLYGTGSMEHGTGSMEHVGASAPRADKPRSTTANADTTFERFWDAYPRKEAKGAARKAWATVIKTADPETVIAGAERFRDIPGREPRFTPHPATWLSAERWSDQPTATDVPRASPNRTGHQPFQDDPTVDYYAEL